MAIFTAIGTALGATGAAATLTGVGVAGATVAGGIGLGALMSKDSKSEGSGYQMPQAPTPPSFDSSSEKARLAADERRRAMARSSSVNTNPLGLSEEASIAKKKLLGG